MRGQMLIDDTYLLSRGLRPGDLACYRCGHTLPQCIARRFAHCAPLVRCLAAHSMA